MSERDISRPEEGAAAQTAAQAASDALRQELVTEPKANEQAKGSDQSHARPDVPPNIPIPPPPRFPDPWCRFPWDPLCPQKPDPLPDFPPKEKDKEKDKPKKPKH